MSLSHSPKIVLDGLDLCLDAANTKSYPGTGTSWYDLSELKKTGTLYNGLSYDSANKGSFLFDGTNDYGELTSSSSTVNGITICCFVRPTDTSSDRAIITKNGTLLQLNSNSIKWWPDVTIPNVAVTTTLTLNQWYYIAVTQINTNCIIYKNSINIYSSSSTNVYNYTYGLQTFIGGYAASRFFSGNISIIQVYNRVLSAAEINQNYQATRGRYGI